MSAVATGCPPVALPTPRPVPACVKLQWLPDCAALRYAGQRFPAKGEGWPLSQHREGYADGAVPLRVPLTGPGSPLPDATSNRPFYKAIL